MLKGEQFHGDFVGADVRVYKFCRIALLMPLHHASARVAAIAAWRGAQLLLRDFGIQFNVQFQMVRDQGSPDP